MATKDIVLRKQLIKESILGILITLVIATGGVLISNYDDDAQSDMKSKDGENASMRTEHNTIEQALGTGFEVSSFYQTYLRYHNDSFVLNREAATQWLSTLREKNHLANLSVTISPVNDMPLDFAHLKNAVATRAEVHLLFSAVTDSSVYSFIESLERTLPGIVYVRDLKFTRTGDVTSSVITALGQHKILPLINCDLTFLWLGLRQADVAKNPATPNMVKAR